jgi:Arc/MetJ family transcription regulator
MTKTRTTLTIDQDLLRAVKVQAARIGVGDSEIIERAVRHHLGWDILDELWAKADLTEEEGMGLALEAQRWARDS